MKRKKPHKKDDEVWRLETENRELKSLNRSLLKELKKRNRGIHREELKFQPEYVPIPEKPQEKICPECTRGPLKRFEIAGRKFLTCEICQHREKLN